VGSAAELARLLGAPSIASAVTGLQRKLVRARRGLDATTSPAQLTGHIVAMSDLAAILELFGMPVPAVTVSAAGVGAVGSAVVASWEILAGGRTMLSLEPPIEIPDTNALGEPLVDLYGTPWGGVLRGTDAAVLNVTGVPTVRIPSGIPEVE
jgi:hypothetical protein